MANFVFSSDRYTPAGDFYLYSDYAAFLFSSSDYAPSGQFVFGNIASLAGTLNSELWLDGSLSGICYTATVGYLNGGLELTGTLTGKITNPSLVFEFSNDNYSPAGGFFFGTSSATYHGFLNGELWLDGSLSGISTSHSIGILNGELWLSGNANGSVTNNIATLSGEVGGLDGLMTGKYDFNVSRPLACIVTTELRFAQLINQQVCAVQQATQYMQCQVDAAISNADLVGVCIDSAIGKIGTIYSALTVGTDNALLISSQLSSSVGNTTFLSTALNSIVEQAVMLGMSLQSIQDVLLFLHQQSASVNADCGASPVEVLKHFYRIINQYTPDAVFSFAADNYQPNGHFLFDSHELITLREAMFKGVLTQAFNASSAHSVLMRRKFCTQLQQARQPSIGKTPRIDPPRPPAPPQPSDHQTIIIPVREVYTVQHSISVINQAGKAIPLSKISLSFDVDSYAWQFSGVLADKAALPDVNMAGNTPEQLTITVNSYVFVMLVESIEKSRSFGKTDITLKGRGLSALLGAPYQLQGSYTAGSDATVQQISDSLMPVDWLIDWQCATWLVPANAYSHAQQTPLQALASIAGFIGAAVIPSRVDKTIKIQPRYPVLPWNFHATDITPDLIVPESAIITVNTQSRTQSPIDGVYVHGGSVGGQLAWCRLNGTAGDMLAPTSSNNLMTDVTACRALGERLLAGAATQPTISGFSMPLGGDYPLAEVGKLVEVMGERGIINGLSISAEFGKVSQTITIGENTSNAYSKLTALLPHYPLLVGNVASTYGDMAILTLLDGGVITARGTGVVGLNYYVRNGLIESAAPNLALSEIVI